ncbi:hypothetical protein ACWDTQ_22920 [Streptomyces cellulosae]|uniref:Uncharacterized protein n=1 Tax=Streptomyces cellulosae TaxID=1968 RepID=A0ABW6JLG3_STRCE
MTNRHSKSRRHRRRRVPADALRYDLRRPAWRWSFLAVTVLGVVQLGPTVVTTIAAAVTVYAWWPVLRGRRP